MGGGGSYKQFNKIVNSNNIINYKNQNFIKSQINNFFAFSLIELSIVLIIIGLLVAGVTGGASLIDSAKVRSLINEFTSYKQALYAFKAEKGRLPGDIHNYGKVGKCSGYTYTSSDFKEPYNGNNSDYGIPVDMSAPFVELYLSGIINFEPKNVNECDYDSQNNCRPSANTYKDAHFFYVFNDNVNSCFKLPTSNDVKHARYGTLYGIYLQLISNRTNNKGFSVDIAEKLDQKMDDGKYNSGSFRGGCDTTFLKSYDELDKKSMCVRVDYFLGDI